MQLFESAMRSRITSFRVESKIGTYVYEMFFDSINNKTLELIIKIISEQKWSKINMVIFAKYTGQPHDAEDS